MNHIFQKGLIDLKQNGRQKNYFSIIFWPNFSWPFMWSDPFCCECLLQKNTLTGCIAMSQQQIASFYFIFFEANAFSKKGHTSWKARPREIFWGFSALWFLKYLGQFLSALAISGHSEWFSPGEKRSKVGRLGGLWLTSGRPTSERIYPVKIFEIARALRNWPNDFKNHRAENPRKISRGLMKGHDKLMQINHIYTFLMYFHVYFSTIVFEVSWPFGKIWGDMSLSHQFAELYTSGPRKRCSRGCNKLKTTSTVCSHSLTPCGRRKLLSIVTFSACSAPWRIKSRLSRASGGKTAVYKPGRTQSLMTMPK